MHTTYVLPISIKEPLPSMVKNELEKLPPKKQEEFAEEYVRREKTTGLAYLFWFLLGWHYVYLGKWGLQFLFWFTLGGLSIWWIIDAFRMPGLIRHHNKDLAIEVLKNLKMTSS